MSLLKNIYSTPATILALRGVSRSVIFAGAALFMFACNDDPLVDDNDLHVGDEEYIEGFSIGFNMELPAQASSRAYNGFDSFEDYENYIDTKDMLRVFFFDENGNFMFGAIDRTVTPLSTNESNSSYNWYVRIPVNYVVDRNGEAFDVDIIRDHLRKHPFKIAVLANWPNKDVVLVHDGDNDSDSGSNSSSNSVTAVQQKDEPLWGFRHSIFCPDAQRNGATLKNINDLHHLVNDVNYADNTRADRPTNREVYDFVMEKQGNDYLMGVKTDWVKMLDDILEPGDNDGKVVAEDWIKKNWDPTSNNNLRHYTDLWYCWNFNEIHNDGQFYNYSSLGWGTTIMTEQWRSRQRNEMIALFGSERGWKQVKQTTTVDGLTIVPGDNVWATAPPNFSPRRYGIHLPQAENLDYNENENKYYVNEAKTNAPKNYLKFTAPASGTYRIKYSLSDQGGEGRLYVQRSSNLDKNEKVSSTAPTDFLSSDGGFRDLSITDDAEEIFIFNNGSGPIFIYAIEYICRKYLYDTDRVGVEPSAERPIPMYGVQNFPALGDAWKEGSTFNLSDSGDGNGDSTYIGLIRSLAKVEVFIDKSIADAHGGVKHILMRSMNRTSRCEPVDVENPTNWFWDDGVAGHSGGRCEWFDIQSYGPAFIDYEGSEAKDYTGLPGYTNFLSWYYGSWMYDYSRGNDGKITKTRKTDNAWWNFAQHNTEGSHSTGSVTLPTATNDYPHLFNPDINRSDFCRFISMGETGNAGYYRFVLYVPDKNLDDPNYPAVQKSVPKVPHIEYRFADQPDSNLDDDNCYRIYFTDYSGGSNILGVTNRSSYADYEKSSVNLSHHWPIVRNHVYQFYVGGTGVENPTVKAKVKDWGYEFSTMDW